MRDAVVIDAVRTPIGKGKPGGAPSGLHPVDLHAQAIRALVDLMGMDPTLVDDVLSGAVGQIGEQRLNTARSAVLATRLPESVPAVTIAGSAASATTKGSGRWSSGRLNGAARWG
jgi:acetyl-CoA acyltransferase